MKYQKDTDGNLILESRNFHIYEDEVCITDLEINRLFYNHDSRERERFSVEGFNSLSSKYFYTLNDAVNYFNKTFEKIPKSVIKEFTKFIVDKYIIGK